MPQTFETKFKETEIGMIPEDWEIKILRDKINIHKESIKPEKFSNDPFVLYSLPSFDDEQTPERVFGKEIKSSKFKVNSETVLFPKLNLRFERIWKIPKASENFVCSTEYLPIKSETLNFDFLYYLLKSSIIKKLQKTAGGTSGSHQRIRPESLLDLLVAFPKNLEEQKKIAYILSTLDEKMGVLKEQNRSLEETGRSIFKKWFIDNPEREGWEVGKLGDYAESISGCSYTSKGLESSENALVTLKSIGIKGFKQNGFKEYTGKHQEKHVVINGEIVVAHTDLTQARIILGKPTIVRDFGKYKKMIASMDLSIVRTKKLINIPFLYYLLGTRLFHGHAQAYSNGTTVIHLSRRAISEFNFSIPEKELLDKFEKLSNNLFEKISNNDLESQTLSQIKDLLLPKLISGKLRVNL